MSLFDPQRSLRATLRATVCCRGANICRCQRTFTFLTQRQELAIPRAWGIARYVCSVQRAACSVQRAGTTRLSNPEQVVLNLTKVPSQNLAGLLGIAIT